MSQILAFSFDCLSSPSITLRPPDLDEQTQREPYGRGFAWYNNEELSSTIIKETKYENHSTLINVMQDFSKFHSTIFIGHIRGAAKRLVLQDTQPFGRSYAGRDWIFVHNGDLQSDYASYLPLEKNSFFEPIGSTDSEYIFCYLLEKIKKVGARSLAEIGWENLHSWLIEINQLGTANIMLSDGQDTMVYHDKKSFNPLYWLRSCPPHEFNHFETEVFSVEITAPFDMNHTFMLISNQNLNQRCQRMHPQQMMILRGGKAIWDSAVDNEVISPEIIVPIQEILIEPPKKIIQPSHVIDYVASAQREYFSIHHETIYHYESNVELSKHLFHLHPMSDHIQAVLEYKLFVSVAGYGEFFEDVFGNIATFYRINSPYSQLIIRSESIVCIADNPSHQSENLHQRTDIPLVWHPLQKQMMSPYLLPPELPESELNELIDFAMSFVKRNSYDLMEVLNDINKTIYNDFEYVPGSTSLATTPYELYRTRRGVCQDFTNLFICLARLLNVPARYRVGYINIQDDNDNKFQSDASHAWVELYLPFIGWYGFDPTNGCLTERNHIRVACGRNYTDATPTTGTIYKGGGHEKLAINVQVTRLSDYPIKNFA